MVVSVDEDLSSAFDTVDHQILLDVLERRFAITDAALAWFHSYLSDRSYTVHISGSTLNVTALVCGVPQGLVLGPKTFIAYTEDIDSIFTHHGVHHHAFADDTQTYLAVTRHNAPTVAPRLQNCLLSKRHK